MKEQLEQISHCAEREIVSAGTLTELDNVRVKYLGKKGELTAVLKNLGNLSVEERPVAGQMVNEVRTFLEQILSAKVIALHQKEMEEKLEKETIDITLPAKKRELGHKHPLTIVTDELKDIFIGLGYEIADGPEIETTYYNFSALNIPENHPSRDLQDTFYINEEIILRTQTSPVQIRVMQSKKPPIKIVCPGKVYRSDDVDATHSPVFHQIEGLVIDKNITMADLKGTLELVARKLFGENTKIRLRPHHFPFTEPSAEVDISCFACGGKGCRVCKGEGWIEILGAGMVHPKVLEECGIDSNEYSGFAFGMGIERLVMKKFNINDMRVLYENDIRFLKQF